MKVERRRGGGERGGGTERGELGREGGRGGGVWGRASAYPI